MTRRDRADVLRQIDRLYGGGDAELLRRLRDGAPGAFEAIVERHGAGVRARCEAIAVDPDAAEDAYQRTLLALHRRGATIRDGHALEGWLREVARRESIRARRQARRRVERVRSLDGLPMTDEGLDGPERAEVRAAVREELAALPEPLRGPVELCDLHGLSRAEAAGRLGLTEGAIRGRLARGRRLLRRRLEVRGVSPSVVLAALGWGRRGAVGIGFGLPARIAAVVAALMVVGVLAWWTGGSSPAVPPVVAGSTGPSAPAPRLATVADDDRTTNHYAGRVVDEDGKPVPGASIALMNDDATPGARVVAKAGEDGRFDLTIPEVPRDNIYDRSRRHSAVLVAWAEGYGPSWFRVGPDASDVPFTLVPDLPVEGRVLDPDGQPLAGATVDPSDLFIPQGSLDDYIRLISSEASLFSGGCHEQSLSLSGLPWMPDRIVTDAEGRFTIRGLGRERYLYLSVRAPGYPSEGSRLVTRLLEDTPRKVPLGTLHDARPTVTLTRGRAAEGVVLDKQTREPVGGVGVSVGGLAEGVTDAEGRFRIEGLRPEWSNVAIYTLPMPGELHFIGHDPSWRNPAFAPPPTEESAPQEAAKPKEPPPIDEPIRAEVLAPRGVPYRLKLTDAETGEPVEAEVKYWPVLPNPEAEWSIQVTPADDPFNRPSREPDGTYAGAVLPGPGVLVVKTPPGSGYRPVRPIDLKAAFRPDKTEWAEDEKFHFGTDAWIYVYTFHTGLAQDYQTNYQAILPVEPEAGDGPLELSAALERDHPPSGRVVGPDGEPARNILAVGLSSENALLEAFLPDGTFTAPMIPPGRSHRVRFYDYGHRLYAERRVKADDPESPYTVRLEPWSGLTGRLLDADGRPLAGAKLMTEDQAGRSVTNSPFVDARYGIITHFETLGALPPEEPRPIERSATVGPDGRFRLEALAPGTTELLLHLEGVADAPQAVRSLNFRGEALKPGEVRDLGDLRLPLGSRKDITIP